MDRTESPLIAVAVCLAALAGFVDAVAFTSLSGFFATTTGADATRLGIGLGSGVADSAGLAGALLLSFVSGVMAASVAERAAGPRRQPAAMMLVTGLLVLAAAVALLWPGPLVLLLLSAAMGARCGVFGRDEEIGIGLIAVTVSLVRIGQKLAGALMGDRDRWSWVPHLALATGFVAGAVSGAASELRWGWGALWLAAFVAAVLTAAIARLGRGRPAAE